MDIAALSIDLKQVQLQQAVGTAVLKMAMDSSRRTLRFADEGIGTVCKSPFGGCGLM